MRLLCLRLLPPNDALREPDRSLLAGAMEEFSARIGWIDHGEAAGLALDVGGTAHGFGGEAGLVEHLRRRLDERRLVAVCAAADTLGAAWAVAQALPAGRSGRFACRRVPPGRTLAALAPLPLETLRLSPTTLRLLRELGFATIGGVLQLPRDAVAERFAPELLQRLDEATGRAAEVFAPYRPAPQWEAAESWESGLVSVEQIARACERLLPRVLEPIAAQGLGVVRWTAELTGEAGGRRRLLVGLLRPTLVRRHLIELLQLRLESLVVREPIVGVRLAVLDAAPPAVRQATLFDETTPPIESTQWTSLVERLAGRLGPDAVLRIRPRADHQPERAWRGEPWIERRRRGAASGSRGGEERFFLPPRPTLLLPRPRPIRVLALAPQGHPQSFHDRGRESRVVRSRGPERIETGWWRGPSLRRDYFQVETAGGVCCWLFRNLRTQGWFLHGWFD